MRCCSAPRTRCTEPARVAPDRPAGCHAGPQRSPALKHLLSLALALSLPLAPRAQAPSLLPPLDDVTRVVATADGAVLALPALLDRLAKADVVFLGETHIDDVTHRVELAVLEGLLARKPGKVVLSM